MSHLNKNQRVKPTAELLLKALALGLVLIFIGCESEPPPKAAPAVVRKKIEAGQPDTAKNAEAGKKDASKATAASNKPASTAPVKQAAPQDQPAKPATKAASTTAAPKSPQKAAGQTMPEPASASPADEGKAQVIVAAAEGKAPTPDPSGAAQSDAKMSGVKTETTPGESPMKMASAAGRPPVIIVDPFEPLFKEEAPEQKPSVTKPDRPTRIPQTPLEKIDLGQLKLTAIMRTPAGNKALVEEASGKGYIIQKGTWIGVHAGRVQEITDDAVVVEEEIENALGEISLTKRELKLQKPPGE
jgi:type IV pilus assembly protein PilP